jgi:hypothetical protein
MIIALNQLIEGANNKHSFEINIAKRNDKGIDISHLIDPYGTGLKIVTFNTMKKQRFCL